jgi:hypothetical protein
VHCLAPHYAKTEDEGRALIREMLSSSADVVPHADRLRICLHSLANPRSNQALAHLCTTLNALALQYPGTTLTLACALVWSPYCGHVCLVRKIGNDSGKLELGSASRKACLRTSNHR